MNKNSFIIKSERHRNALNDAIKTIKENILVSYINDIILYGSCARQEEKWKYVLMNGKNPIIYITNK